MTDEVRKIMAENGCSARQAYRIINKSRPVKDQDFDYDKETPKGEWI